MKLLLISKGWYNRNFACFRRRIISSDQVYFIIKLDENDEKTVVKSIENPYFSEKFTFPIEDKQRTLSYKLYSANINQFIAGTELLLYIINLENEESHPDFELKDDSKTIGVFKPKRIIFTSYYDMYQIQYDNIDKNIESYQNRIN